MESLASASNLPEVMGGSDKYYTLSLNDWTCQYELWCDALQISLTSPTLESIVPIEIVHMVTTRHTVLTATIETQPLQKSALGCSPYFLGRRQNYALQECAYTVLFDR